MIKLSAFMFLIVLIVLLASCDSAKPYINFTLKADKINDDCSQASPEWTVEANTAGERYVFYNCLFSGYDTKLASMEQKGDTLLLHFNEDAMDSSPNMPTAVYKLTLDVDTYPKYKHVQLGDRIIDISVDGN
jgi:hypothetical protein